MSGYGRYHVIAKRQMADGEVVLFQGFSYASHALQAMGYVWPLTGGGITMEDDHKVMIEIRYCSPEREVEMARQLQDLWT